MSAAGLQAQEYRQSITTNNLANAQTAGFKRDLALVQSRLNAFRENPALASLAPLDNPALLDQGGGVGVLPAVIDLSQGNLQPTGNQTDLALQGAGFFTVRNADGKTALTRDGRFTINSEDMLVTATGGHSVLDASGQPIKLNPQLPIAVDSHGVISQGSDGSAGVALGLQEVTNPQALEKLGGNLLAAPPEALRAASADTTVRQGYVESSTVDPVIEMVNMMEGQRIFDANAKLITMQDQTLAQLNTLGKVA
jgi:flagellar basal body rod protein FlgG